MVLARGWVDLGSSGEPLESILAEFAWLYETWHGKNHDRVRVASGPLAPWRCCDDAIREITALARSWTLPTHIHVAETQDEIDLLFARCGRRHIEWLADLGCLGPDTQLVHAVHVNDAEIELDCPVRRDGRPLPHQQPVPSLRRSAGAEDARQGNCGGAGH